MDGQQTEYLRQIANSCRTLAAFAWIWFLIKIWPWLAGFLIAILD
jgi:hypothetical protein